MASAGFLQALAGGLNQGVQSFDTEQKYQQQKKLQNQQAQMGLLGKNMELDDQGNVIYSPIGQQEQDVLTKKTQGESESYDPSSQSSISARQAAKQVLKSAKPGMENSISDDMSANQVQQQMKLFEPAVKGGFDAQGRLITANASSARTTANLEERQNTNSAKAGQAFESDPIIKLSKTNLNSLQRSQSILENPNKPVTTRDLNLAYTDYVNAVAAGGAATEGKIQRELPETWATEFNNLKAKAGDFDDLRQNKTGSQLIQMLKQNIATVKSDIGSAVEEQAANVHDSFANSSNPKTQQTIQDKLKKYAPGAYQQKYGGGAPSPGLLNPGPQAQASKGMLPAAKAGDTVTVKGKQYRVGADGNSLEPL